MAVSEEVHSRCHIRHSLDKSLHDSSGSSDVLDTLPSRNTVIIFFLFVIIIWHTYDIVHAHTQTHMTLIRLLYTFARICLELLILRVEGRKPGIYWINRHLLKRNNKNNLRRYKLCNYERAFVVEEFLLYELWQ